MDTMHLKPIGNETLLANLFSSATFRILFAASLLFATLLVPVTYWALDNQRPYDFYGPPESYIIPNEATGNDQMIVSWKVKANRQCDGSIRRELFDPRTKVVLAVYDPQPIDRHAMPEQDGYFNSVFLLPRMIQTGRIGYRSHREYWCNPLQRIWPLKYTTPDLFFEVKG